MKFTKLGDTLHPADEEATLHLIQMQEGDEIGLEAKPRTSRQNNALHKWCADCAETLNGAGQDMRKTLRHDADIPWTQYSFKEYVWRPVQAALTGEESTTKPSRSEYPAISETIHRHIAERVKVRLPPWPCQETQMQESYREAS